MNICYIFNKQLKTTCMKICYTFNKQLETTCFNICYTLKFQQTTRKHMYNICYTFNKQLETHVWTYATHLTTTNYMNICYTFKKQLESTCMNICRTFNKQLEITHMTIQTWSPPVVSCLQPVWFLSAGETGRWSLVQCGPEYCSSPVEHVHICICVENLHQTTLWCKLHYHYISRHEKF